LSPCYLLLHILLHEIIVQVLIILIVNGVFPDNPIHILLDNGVYKQKVNVFSQEHRRDVVLQDSAQKAAREGHSDHYVVPYYMLVEPVNRVYRGYEKTCLEGLPVPE
jgi:hypothetical protein